LIKFLSVISILDDVLSYIATAAFLINSVQLAIDQLADASAGQVSSFIRWYVFTFMFGAWIFHQLTVGPLHYCTNHDPLVEVLMSLAQVILVSLALCLAMVCGNHIKAIPIGDNPLKLIWKVLRFAAKHEYPVRRSALTYWEDEIPSRVNLGKDKYGGPFTNEQVEDVKTFFRIISLTIPTVFAIASGKLVSSSFVFSVYWREDTLMDFNYTNISSVNDHCTRSLYASFPASDSLWICLCVLCGEFIVYPMFNRCIPSMLKRIGFAFFVIIPESITFLILNIVALAKPVEAPELVLCSIVSVFSALQYYILLSSFLEFICAQSPQSMKGFLIGFMWLMDVLVSVISYFIYYPWNSDCTMLGCGTGYFSLVTIFILIGFIFYCKVARWYRNRERDDCPNDQAIVEEVFARRLANRKRFGLDES
jgi:peptide/histidine transporter 3/4